MSRKIYLLHITKHNETANCCCAQYYNFKKGMEYCSKRENCPLYKGYVANLKKKDAGMKVLKFEYIDDFRNCERFRLWAER